MVSVSKKSKIHRKQPPKPRHAEGGHETAQSVAKQKKPFNWKQWLPLPIILLIAWFTFQPALDNGLTNWDDKTYLLENEHLYHFTWEKVKFFFTNVYFANYHPLTMLTYLVEFHYYQLNPWIYHFDNLLLHLLNTLLVFVFIQKLAGKINVAVIVSLLFAIHPMHVESVAWAAERKDVLYSFFYLLALIISPSLTPQKGLKTLWKWDACFFFFLLALLSKSAAVTLPVVMLLIDFLKGRIQLNSLQSFKMPLIEKIPFFILSIFFGIVAWEAQETSNAIAEFDTFTLLQRIMFACYGLCMYVFKLFVPFAQSNFYPYPFINREGFMANFLEGNLLPDFYYISPFVVLLIAGIVWWSFRHTKKVMFGALFFFVNVALLLQFVSVGNAVMAERYTYISYIGIFLLIGWGFDFFHQKQKNISYVAATLLLGGMGFFCWKSYNRCQVWENSGTLWTNFISNYPNVHDGYVNRSTFWVQYQDYESALKDLNIAIKIKPNYAKTYANRGNIHGIYGRYEQALADYNEAIKLSPNYFDAHFNRAINYSIMKDYEKAFVDYTKAIELKPNHSKTYLNRAYAYVEYGSFDKAIDDCTVALKINPQNETGWFYRGLAFHNKKEYDKAINDYNQTLKINSRNSGAWFNRSLCFNEKQQYYQALQDAIQAKNLGYTVSETYIENLQNAPKQ
ncbi:MAG: hypothetical protein COA57_04850 [Flavobacteriales bacterium]|nr:MAG: hypothetical protein COA57_04850 [Flavobacteriales bacterium]